MSECKTCVEISGDIHSLFIWTQSDHLRDENILQPENIAWGCSPHVSTISDATRQLAIWHCDVLSEIESSLNELDTAIVPYRGAITSTAQAYGLDLPTAFPNYHLFALGWLRKFVSAWRESWSEFLNPIYPFVERFDPRKLFFSEDSKTIRCDYPWSTIRHTAENVPEHLWNPLAEAGWALFFRSRAIEAFPIEAFARESSCLKHLVTDERHQDDGTPRVRAANDVASQLRDRPAELLAAMGELKLWNGNRRTQQEIKSHAGWSPDECARRAFDQLRKLELTDSLRATSG